MVSVTLGTSFLGVRDGRVRGCMWSSLPRVPYGTGVVPHSNTDINSCV